MSGKVKCTCGWSWDKKDSSKKDMYVCHECGKDNSMKNGGWLSKYAEDGVEAKKKPESLLNLTDLTYTPMELNFLNDVKNGYCPTGNCLESSRKAYDMTAGRIKGISGSNDIWTKDLNLISTPGRPSEKQVQENPYFKGDIKSGSADSWDIHGAIVKAGGKNIYSGASKQIVPTDIPTGAVAGWGPAVTKGTTHKERGQGMNTQFGLQPSHHSTESVGYDDNGKAIFYDSYTRKYGTLEEIGKELKSKLGYELENISVPKSVAGNTRENLNKKGILKNELTPFSANVDKLLSATKQPWAQINEDGKSRSPNADKEKLSKFAQSLTDNKGELISSLGLSNADYDRLANSALAIAMTESEGGGALGFSDRFGNTKGMTQLNIDNIKKDDRLKTALSKKYKGDGAIWNIQDPYNSAIATMMYLSVADKDAKRLYNKGLTPGIKTVNQPGLIENFRSTNSKLNKDGLFIDELNKRVPYSEIPGYEDGDTTKVNNYLKQLTKSDRYSFVNKDGDLSLKLKTKGNNPKLTDVEKIAYMWQSPNSLKTGDAEGKSQYVNKIKNYYDALTKFNDGGPIQPNYNDADAFYSEDYVGAGYDIIGRNYSPAWGGQFAMGGSLPGSVGFSYARTKGIPSNGPYAKKTKASAQDGKEISYDQWKKQYKLKETPDYNLKRAWELGYTPDKTGHLPTVDNQTGQFLKSKGHPTLKLELDWYNSPEGAEFKSKNTLDSTGKFFKYIPKLQNGKEMQFYQNGLDWKPKSISRDGAWLSKYQVGGNIVSYEDAKAGNKKSASVNGKDNPTGRMVDYSKNKKQSGELDYGLDIGMQSLLDQIPYYPVATALNSFLGEGRPFTAITDLLKQPIGWLGDVGINMAQENSFGYDVKSLEDKIIPAVRLAKNALFSTPVITQIGRQILSSGKTPKSTWSDGDYNLPPIYDAAKSLGVDNNTFVTFIEDNWEKSGNDYKKLLELAKVKFKKNKPSNKKEDGGIIEDDRGQWDHPGEITKINSNEITMQGVDYPVLGVSDTGDTQMMQPDEEYKFKGKSVTEYPMMKKGGWLSKYN